MTYQHACLLTMTCALWFCTTAFAADDEQRDALIFYPAYGDTRHSVVEGRVIKLRSAGAHQAADGWWANLWRNARLMVNSEREDAAIELSVSDRTLQTRTDEEGYFRQAIEGGRALLPGWHTVHGRFGKSAAEGKLLVVPATNTVGVISDLDDTLLVSEVNNKRVLLANTFLKNPQQRQAVAGTAQFIRSIAAGNPQPELAPVIYLSASPRQLQSNITAFLEHNGFPAGVLLTKRVTNDKTRDPLRDQMAYKTAKIEEIFARLPHVRFVLMGDDGERDPEIYQRMRERHPGRIERILIRRVHPDPARATYPDQLNLGQVIDSLAAGSK